MCLSLGACSRQQQDSVQHSESATLKAWSQGLWPALDRGGSCSPRASPRGDVSYLPCPVCPAAMLVSTSYHSHIVALAQPPPSFRQDTASLLIGLLMCMYTCLCQSILNTSWQASLLNQVTSLKCLLDPSSLTAQVQAS